MHNRVSTDPTGFSFCYDWQTGKNYLYGYLTSDNIYGWQSVRIDCA